MGLFDRFRGSKVERVIEDPLLGPLEYSETGCWRGDAFFEPAGDEIAVEILSMGPDPTEEQRQTFVQLGERYASLLSGIARSLFDLYTRTSKAGAVGGLPKVRSSEEILGLTQLNWVEIGSGGLLRLGYGFRESVDGDDPVFIVRIKDWAPSGEEANLQ